MSYVRREYSKISVKYVLYWLQKLVLFQTHPQPLTDPTLTGCVNHNPNSSISLTTIQTTIIIPSQNATPIPTGCINPKPSIKPTANHNSDKHERNSFSKIRWNSSDQSGLQLASPYFLRLFPIASVANSDSIAPITHSVASIASLAPRTPILSVAILEQPIRGHSARHCHFSFIFG